jgi:hypothetical protein
MSTIWVQADIDALKAAIASGILQVQYDGPPKRSITYQSLSEMRRLLAEMVGQVAESTGTRTTYRRVGTKKGFDTP